MNAAARLVAALFLAGASAATAAAEEALICFNYACKDTAVVEFDETELKQVHGQFAEAATPEAEREAVARAVGFLYFFAGQRSPVWRDRGGNYADGEVDGRMDCIDHSTNTTTFLDLLERRGWMRFHDVGERAERGRFLSEHWTARIVERDGGAQFAVDTWFLDPGEAASIFTLEEWLDGAWPEGRSFWLNGR
ncbi:MAG: hypothetical protein MUC55_03440 [Burkholderiales bacterium]|jgi:hypothetical protein|nr:hypothetical protein [Burkholderiales bacterium]